MPKRKMIGTHPPTTPVSNVCRPHPVWGPQLYMWGLHICRVWLVYVSFAAPEIMSITFTLQKIEKNKIWNTESESAFCIIKLLSKAYQSTSDKSKPWLTNTRSFKKWTSQVIDGPTKSLDRTIQSHKKTGEDPHPQPYTSLHQQSSQMKNEWNTS